MRKKDIKIHNQPSNLVMLNELEIGLVNGGDYIQILAVSVVIVSAVNAGFGAWNWYLNSKQSEDIAYLQSLVPSCP